MPVSSLEVANEFICLAKGDGRQLTPMQLMKLVYIAHGWSLGLDGRPLISEKVLAWRYGPVIPVLYSNVKSYGSGPITEPLAFGVGGSMSPREQDLVRQTYAQYGKLNGIRLSEMTHRPGTPWSITIEQSGRDAEIPADLIAEHYRRLADARRAA